MAVRITLRRAPLHAPQRCRLLFLHRSPSPRYSSDFSHLREKLLSRQLPYAADYITPIQSRALKLTLQRFLPFPRDILELKAHRLRHDSMIDTPLSPTHHLVYFPNVLATSLLPDGTDPWHSPGPPFTRRMWAGGTMALLQDMLMNGDPFHCTESIEDVQVRGEEGNERMFVKVKRLIFAGRYPGELAKHQPYKRAQDRPNTKVRIIEDQTSVFMRDNCQEDSPAASQAPSNVLKPKHTPDFSHTMVPTRELLFRFSALTFNAHAIHLDRQYCRETEGHRNLLVHGPLTVVLMIEVLRSYLQALVNEALVNGALTNSRSHLAEKRPERIEHIAYRNLAPLYAEEEMKICVRRRGHDHDKEGNAIWDVWIEGTEGGYAVKGTVKTSTRGFVGSTPSRRVLTPTVAQQEVGLEEESIPKESIAFQRASNTRDETELNEDISAEGKSEHEAEESVEGDSAPYNQR